MKLYHGTDKTSQKAIVGPPKNINSKKGGGELGQGFYLGDNMTMAISWAKGRSRKASVIEFEISNSKYALLNFKQMSHSQILKDWYQMKKLGTQRTHKYGFDVVFGPLATNPFAAQYKFETTAGENLLNNSNTGIIL